MQKETLITELKKSIELIQKQFEAFTWDGRQPEETEMQLINELPFSFIYRFLSVSVIGLIGVIILLLINFLVDKLILKDVNISKLRELAVKALVPVILVALFGVLVFFFL
ncbi:MAG: hypothetical protein ABI793_14140 [Flavobacterium sp.]